MSRPAIKIDEVDHLPFWRKPEFMLLLMTGTVWFGLSMYLVLINNFAVEVAGLESTGTPASQAQAAFSIMPHAGKL